MPTTATPGQSLRALRNLARMTLAEVALKAGSGQSYLSQVETGKVTPSTAFIARVSAVIADGLKVAA